jgi:hypothetical protein
MDLTPGGPSKGQPLERDISARWLRPNENVWGFSILDCTQYADGMMSFTSDPKIAEEFNGLRTESGRELPGASFTPSKGFRCNLEYTITKEPPDGPVFKSLVMEQKWDIYLYDSCLFFRRSWTGALTHRAVLETELPRLRVASVESAHTLPDGLAVRQVDFLIKSHLLLAAAVHPLLPDLGQDAEKQAHYTFNCYGSKGRYGTLVETVGTPYYWNRALLSAR